MAMDKLESNKKIAFLGVGNMARAMIDAMLDHDFVSARQLVLYDPIAEKASEYFGAKVAKDNRSAAKSADIVVLAVKPQRIDEVLEEIKGVVTDKHFVVSIAAGVTLQRIQSVLGDIVAVLRVMPNMCAQVSKSVSCWAAGDVVNNEQEQVVKGMLSVIGSEHKVSEDIIDEISVVSGSGPAYVLYLVELMTEMGVELGLDKELAEELARETVIGTGAFLAESEKSADVLRAEVTSKEGITEAAFDELEGSDVEEVFLRAARAALKRTKELASDGE